MSQPTVPSSVNTSIYKILWEKPISIKYYEKK